MNTIKIITAIFICMFGYACKRQHLDNTEEQFVRERIEFDIQKQNMLDNIDSIKVREVIKLGIDPNSPVGQIDKVIIAKDRVFVLDRTFSRFLYVYDRQGNFLYKIGYKGGGPGEYTNTPKDFHVDELQKRITVFDSEIKTLNSYDWEGKLVATQLLKKTWPYTFTKSDSLFYFAYKTEDSDSHLLRIEDEKENTCFKYLNGISLNSRYFPSEVQITVWFRYYLANI